MALLDPAGMEAGADDAPVVAEADPAPPLSAASYFATEASSL